jgi:Arc/MetJ-type ribon-helix-helix transcriptional regulator
MRKVVVEIVQFDSVSVSIPDNFSDKIEEWTDEQRETVSELVQDKLNETRMVEWSINEEDKNGGFVEIVND